MDENRKSAFRYLMYWAIVLDVRPVAWFSIRWLHIWNPFYWRRELRRIRYAGAVADWLHNLALFSSLEFERFDEARFWKDLEFLEEYYPEFLPSRFRKIFDERLRELTTELTTQ
jgi:hypothetical protein